MWATFKLFLSDINPLINLGIAILWGIYVYFTIKTFKEIHRQTELQSEAFLIVSCDVANSNTEKTINKVNRQNIESYDKWHGILNSHIPAAIGQDSYLLLKFTNKGRSDITEWQAVVNVRIMPGQYLNKKFNIGGEDVVWEFKRDSAQDIIPAGESVAFVIAKVGVYPQVECNWEIKYSDMRDKHYKSFNGDCSKVIENTLAYSMKEEIE